MDIKVIRLKRNEQNEETGGTGNTYQVTEGGRQFIIECKSHPHHGTSLILSGKEGTLHLSGDEDRVVRQIVALGGGCALAIHEEVVEGLSPASFRAVIMTHCTGGDNDFTGRSEQ